MFGHWNRMSRSFFGRLQWKLFVFFLILTVIPAILIGYVLYNNAYKAIEEKTGLYSEQIMVQSAGRLDALLTGIEDISLQMVSAVDIQQLIKEISENDDVATEAKSAAKLKMKLGQILSSKREIVGAQVLMAEKDLAITSGETMVSADYKLSNEYTQAMSRPEPVYWRGTIRNQSPSMLYEYLTTLTRKIYDPSSGMVMGTLVLGTKEFALADTFSYIDLGPNGFVFIMDKEGKVVSHLSKKKLTKPAEYSFVPQIVHSGEGDNRIFSSDLDGQKFMITYAKSTATGWYVVSAIPYSYLMERIVSVGKFAIQLDVVLFLLAILISLLISISISRPVQRLVAAMGKVEGGDLKVFVNLKSNNEIGVLGNSFNRMLKRINQLIDRVYEAEILQKDAEIKALQSQINPHFLYNTLSVIDSIATVKQEKEISAITQMLADIFRYSTNGNDVATIEEEVGQLQRYLHIQKTRYGEDLRWQFIIDPNVRECKIVKLLLQPIVENSVIHGIRKAGTIKVIILPSGDNLSIAVEDNGSGMTEEELTALIERLETSSNRLRSKTDGGSHIGLANVCHRIKSFYGEAFGLTIVSSEGLGTKVTITIPIVREAEQNDER
ncbi:cache domain-containing sensor histidine kinase [Cohnella herbarum]|uniref:histidine kinase n=1 Tax=Cohnella herbarum TaxID=2728023 RepID=A0A7Z2VR15_9BACL|nr:sensor histidine kinase [Cohnella herbarum]QJD87345.1 sensor histidine kinase [Cohnella herbarum]